MYAVGKETTEQNRTGPEKTIKGGALKVTDQPVTKPCSIATGPYK